MFLKILRNNLILFLGLCILTTSLVGIIGLAQGNTNVRFNVYDTAGLQIPTFSITPPSINIGDNLVFAAEPLLYTNNSVATQIDCEIEIATPDNALVLLSSQTDVNGICDFDLSLPLASQNITVVSGQLASLNNAAGNGSALVRYSFQNTQYTTNTDNYTVVDPLTLVVPPFDITPPQINPGGNLVFKSGVLNFSNSTVASGVACRFTLTPPTGNDVILTSVTDNNGVCQFDLSSDLSSQNITLVSGSIADLNSNLGSGSGLISFTYNNVSLDTNTDTYEVVAVPPDLEIPQFQITPPQITADQDLTFAADPLVFDNGDPAPSVPCELTITTPNNDQVVSESLTDAAGICTYTTSSDPATQGWAIISGDPGIIKTPGTGTGYIEYTFLNSTYTTNVDSYEVLSPAPVLSTPTFEINPNDLLLGDTVTFRLNPVTFDDGSVAAGLVCRLTLIAPDNTTIVLSGLTDAAGVCEYTAPDRSTGWWSVQAAAQLAVDLGNIEALNTFVGSGSGYAEVEYDGVTAITNTDSYDVRGEDEEDTGLQVPDLTNAPDFLVELVRTGGILGVGVIILGLIAIVSILQTINSFLKK